MLSSHKYHLFILAFLITCVGSVKEGYFFAVAPNEYRPGWPLTIAVTTHPNVLDEVFVNVVLGPSDDLQKVYASGSNTLRGGETKLLQMQVPEIKNQGKTVLSVTATGGVTFSSNKSLSYNPTSSLVFVEMDKAIYKPGQKVQFRVVHVDKNLMPIIKPLTAVILNPKDSKLEEYKDIASRTGVAEISYQLLESASVGKWKIQVTDEASMFYEKEFTVEEYVLPKFSVEVKASPDYVVVGKSKTSSVITVESKYTFGKGVQGTCVLTLSTDDNYLGRSGTKLTKQLSDSGKAEFSDLDWSSLFGEDFYRELKIKVTAAVTDETGRTESGEATIKLYKVNAKVEILPKSTMVLKPGIPAQIFIRVSDQGNNPLSRDEVEVTIKVRDLKTIKARLAVPEGQTDITYQFTPELEVQGELHSTWRGYDDGVTVTLSSDRQVSARVSAYVYETKYGNYISVIPTTDKVLRVGQTVEYKVLDGSRDVSYLVISQGSIVTAGVPVDDLISIVPTMEMCPHAKLFVYKLIDAGLQVELVADVLDIKPTRCFGKEVDVSFDASEVRSGTDSTMKVHVSRVDGSNALPGAHTVYYLGIDKSLVLLQGRTDLNKDEVLSGMAGLNLKIIGNQDVAYSAGKIIEGLGLSAFTSAIIAKQDQRPIHPDIMFKNFAGNVADNVDVKIVQESASPIDTSSSSEKKETETKVRKNFPETWLWGHGQTNSSGHLNQAVTLPDTITTWLVSAFAINHEGLAVGSGPFELAAFQIFFLTMNLPYSIKRGEVFVLRVTVFNYRSKDVSANLRLSRSSQFAVIDLQDNNGWYEKSLKIPANRASSAEFKINATEIGLIELHTVAEDEEDGMKDQVKQKLLVKPEGEMRTRTITRAVFKKSAAISTETFFLDWPEEKIVPDSKRVEVKVTGDILGQTLSNMDHLVTVPFGCGEQNMITTVPNIYGLTYIRKTSKVGMLELQTEMLANMKTGYQRQIDNYRHEDGSFSAWGDKGSFHHSELDKKAEGSVWLTAFVLKSFARAAEFIPVDPVVLTSGARFLSHKQKDSGEFVETGQVIHREMQSGTASGPALTLYVLISLLETDQAHKLEQKDDLNKQISLAKQFIIENLDPSKLLKTKNIFLSAMGAYTLALMSDDSVLQLVDQLFGVVQKVGAPWETEVSTKSKMADHYILPSASHDIETAAYYLLALTRLQRLEEGIVLMQWLQSQQNSLGGYGSTQDTVMVLQALSEFGAYLTQSTPASPVTITVPRSGQTFTVDLSGSRAALLHTVELPANTKIVEVRVEGSVGSFCVVKVVYSYYTLAGDDDLAPPEPEVSVFTKTSKLSEFVHTVEACIKSSSNLKYNGMFVTTFTLPSGEEAFDEPSQILASNLRASRVETGKGLIHFYMDEAPGDGYCLQAKVERQAEFEVQKPGSAKFYAYYEPAISQEVPLSLDQSSCTNGQCGSDGADIPNLASVLLTITICALVTLLLFM